MTRDEEIKLEQNITKCLEEEHLYPDYVNVEPWSDFIQITMRIEGDWKRDHRRAEIIMERNLLPKLGLVGLAYNKYKIGHSESDYYTAVHTWVVSVDNSNQK